MGCSGRAFVAQRTRFSASSRHEHFPLGFLRIKVIALSVLELDRANKFYGETLGLPPAYEVTQRVGYLLGQTILMLKANWYAPPTEAPNPRVTIATEDALKTEKALHALEVCLGELEAKGL